MPTGYMCGVQYPCFGYWTSSGQGLESLLGSVLGLLPIKINVYEKMFAQSYHYIILEYYCSYLSNLVIIILVLSV